MKCVGMLAVLLCCVTLSAADREDAQVEQLTQQLAKGKADEQIEAAHQLGEMGLRASSAVPELIRSLDRKDPGLQHEAMLALGQINSEPESVVPVLIRFLSEKSPLLQHGAIESLRMFGPDAQPALPRLLILMALKDEKEAYLPISAARAIVDISPDPIDRVEAVIAVLVKGLSSENAGAQQDAVQGLVSLGKPAVPAVRKLLEGSKASVVLLACDTLGMIGPDAVGAVDGLLTLANAKNPEVRGHALRALGAIGGQADRVVPVLIKQLKGETPAIRIQAARALGNFPMAAATAVPALVAALIDPDAQVRSAVINGLAEYGPAAKAAIPGLSLALDDPEGAVTVDAAAALGRIGKAAVPALAKKLETPAYQPLVLAVLEDIGPDAVEATPALIGLLDSEEVEIQREAILALAAIGPAAKDAIPALLKTVEEETSKVRPPAAYALGRLEAKDAEPVLKKLLNTPDNPTLGLACIWSLLQLDPKNEDYIEIAVPRLTAGLAHERPRVRRESATTLGRLGAAAKSAVPALQKSLADEDPEVRMESLIALAEIGPDSQPAVADLLPLLTSFDPAFRSAACYALGRIGPSAAAQAEPPLRRLLQSRDGMEKTVAAWALVKIAPDEETIQIAIPLLAVALQKAERPHARAVVAETLGEIGSKSPVARAALAKAKDDADESVRQAVEAALKKLN